MSVSLFIIFLHQPVYCQAGVTAYHGTKVNSGFGTRVSNYTSPTVHWLVKIKNPLLWKDKVAFCSWIGSLWAACKFYLSSITHVLWVTDFILRSWSTGIPCLCFICTCVVESGWDLIHHWFTLTARMWLAIFTTFYSHFPGNTLNSVMQ